VNSTPNEVVVNHQMDFAGIASRYSPMLFRVALRRLRNVEDAEDAVQDALLSAYKHIGNFEGRAQLSTWLTTIVINAARMKLRSRPHQEIVSLDQAPGEDDTTLANQLVDARPNPETICAQAERERTLRTALAHISPKLRVAFQMREMAGLSTRETADTLRIKTTTLKSRLKRARTALGLYLDRTNRVRVAEESTIWSRNPTTGLVQARKYWQAQQKIAATRRNQTFSPVSGNPRMMQLLEPSRSRRRSAVRRSNARGLHCLLPAFSIRLARTGLYDVYHIGPPPATIPRKPHAQQSAGLPDVSEGAERTSKC
jgi:RNA polymerase sigma-70 factor (ECF subfamily)